MDGVCDGGIDAKSDELSANSGTPLWKYTPILLIFVEKMIDSIDDSASVSSRAREDSELLAAALDIFSVGL